jgi:hypothetical protein
MTPETLALPALYLSLLTVVFQYLKDGLSNLAPFAPSAPHRNLYLRTIYAVLCAAFLVAFGLVTFGAPHTFAAGLDFARNVLEATGAMLGLGTGAYKVMSGSPTSGSASDSADADPVKVYPPRPPSDFDAAAALFGIPASAPPSESATPAQ